MSHRHIKRPETPLRPIVWWKLALWSAIFVASIGAIWAFANWVHSFSSTYKTADGKILEIRKTVDGVVETQYGSRVVYGLEARVQYPLDGQMQDRWLRASDNMPRETLMLKLAKHPAECLVYWPPNHPENARCWFK
jgi:hypothetical protein